MKFTTTFKTLAATFVLGAMAYAPLQAFELEIPTAPNNLDFKNKGPQVTIDTIYKLLMYELENGKEHVEHPIFWKHGTKLARRILRRQAQHSGSRQAQHSGSKQAQHSGTNNSIAEILASITPELLVSFHTEEEDTFNEQLPKNALKAVIDNLLEYEFKAKSGDSLLIKAAVAPLEGINPRVYAQLFSDITALKLENIPGHVYENIDASKGIATLINYYIIRVALFQALYCIVNGSWPDMTIFWGDVSSMKGNTSMPYPKPAKDKKIIVNQPTATGIADYLAFDLIEPYVEQYVRLAINHINGEVGKETVRDVRTRIRKKKELVNPSLATTS